MKTSIRLLLSLLVLAAFGCAKDKNVQEYQRDQLRQNLGLYQSVAGTYTGVVTSKQDGHVLGAMALQLRADTRTTPSQDGSVAVGSPVLVGNIEFLDQSIINMSAPDGVYDPATKSYSAQINVARSAAGGDGGNAGATGPAGSNCSSSISAETILLDGALHDGVLDGEVSSCNYPSYGGSMHLVRNGGDLTGLLKKYRPGGSANVTNNSTTFSGTTTFTANKETRPVNLVILQQLYGTAEDFLNLVSPLRVVDASLNYSESLRLLFAKSLWNVRDGTLTGNVSLSVAGQNQQMNLNCQQTGADITCNHLSTGGGSTAVTTGKQTPGPVKDRPDPPDNYQSITKTFVGKGCFLPVDRRVMKLVVTYPAESRYENLIELFFPVSEKILQASVLFSDVTSSTFSQTKWDKISGLLDGRRQSGGDASSAPYVANLQCHDFHFRQTTNDFGCVYNTDRSSNVQINFVPPFTGKEKIPDPCQQAQ